MAAAGRGSTVSCSLKGVAQDPALPPSCTDRPPFWEFWRGYRHCTATNACLLSDNLSLYEDPSSPSRLAVASPLACTSWARATQLRVAVVRGVPPPHAEWVEVAIISSRVLAGHFGHDLLNNALNTFHTFWEAGLAHLLEPGVSPRPMHLVRDDDSLTTDGDRIVRVVNYASDPSRVRFLRSTNPPGFTYPRLVDARSTRLCFRTVFLGFATTHSATLVFRRNSATTAKRRMWHAYRSLWLRHFCAECESLLLRPPSPPQLVLFRRSEAPYRSRAARALTANGRGRRILNAAPLAAALRRLAPLVVADPARLSLHAQHLLMARTRVLVTRMTSAAVGALFMPSGGAVVEVEAADPAELYFDHPSTLEELADIFGHSHARSTPPLNEGGAAEAAGPVHADEAACVASCEPAAALRPLSDGEATAACARRCANVSRGYWAWRRAVRGERLYFREAWYQNWWLADTRANIAEVVDLVAQALARLGGVAPHAAALPPAAPHAAALPPPPAAAYEASEWEEAWHAHAAEWQSDEGEWAAGCADLRAHREEATAWLRWVGAREAGGGGAGGEELPKALSGWRRGGARVGAPIEPLVGHLRHPKFHCVGPLKDSFQRMFSTAYLVLPFASELSLPPTARRFFFDLGASTFDDCAMGCQKWFIDSYRQHGIEFDRIFAWEAAAIDHAQFWKKVPAALKPRMQYYNTPVSSDPDSSDNPLRFIQTLATQEDFVVVKLDIDSPSTETSLVLQLLESPQLLELVDEFFWEHHVNGSPLRKTRVSFMGSKGIGWGKHLPAKGSPWSTLADSHALFRRLREKGVRAHAWI